MGFTLEFLRDEPLYSMPLSTMAWSIDVLRHRVQPIIEWRKKHDIAVNRIVVAEFGCNREVEGARRYLADVIALFNQQRWHWAFYAFRENSWPGMDYEIGPDRLPWNYWQAVEAGENPSVTTPLFDTLKREFQPR